MTDDLTQRIQTSLRLLNPNPEAIECPSCDIEVNHICEACFIHGVICDMKREREQLQEQRDVAIKHLAEWCAANEARGGGWDEWDKYYKDAAWRQNLLPEVRDLLNEAIQTAKKKLRL